MKKILVIAFVCTLLDQVIKNVLISVFSVGSSISVIDGFFSITMLQNTGAAFSILSSSTLFLILISIVALNLIYFFLIKGRELNRFDIIVYGVLIGGIIGNLIDRVVHGSVIDYLDFNLFGYNFPVFNFADICIVISIILIIISICKGEKYGVSNKWSWRKIR